MPIRWNFDALDGRLLAIAGARCMQEVSVKRRAVVTPEEANEEETRSLHRYTAGIYQQQCHRCEGFRSRGPVLRVRAIMSGGRARGIHWPVANGKETLWRFHGGYAHRGYKVQVCSCMPSRMDD